MLRGIAATDLAQNEGRSKKKWLHFVLAWVYENRKDMSDPLAVVEELYADFDYPEELAQFVRYMPVADDYDPEIHSLQENEQRLYLKWKEYLDTSVLE